MIGSSTKSSSARSSAGSESGLGAFAPSNRIYMNKPFIDFTNPIEVAAAGALLLVGWYAWRKFK